MDAEGSTAGQGQVCCSSRDTMTSGRCGIGRGIGRGNKFFCSTGRCAVAASFTDGSTCGRGVGPLVCACYRPGRVHAGHDEAARLPHWLPHRLPRKRFLVAAGGFLVAAEPILVAAELRLVAARRQARPRHRHGPASSLAANSLLSVNDPWRPVSGQGGSRGDGCVHARHDEAATLQYTLQKRLQPPTFWLQPPDF